MKVRGKSPAALFARGGRATIVLVNERAFLMSVFAVIEELAAMELSDTSRRLISVYIQDAEGAKLSERARAAIFRYLHADLPSGAELRARAEAGELSRADELLLEMERCAASVR